nr:unnamed protein product [Callosobruchus chinensis]
MFFFVRKLKRLKVPTTPKIVELKEISRRQADRRKLLCKVKGFPVPKIVWRRKGQTLSQNRYLRIQYRRKQSRLTIKKVDTDHIGQYECVAEAPNGRTASRTISVSTSTYPSGLLTMAYMAKSLDRKKAKKASKFH